MNTRLTPFLLLLAFAHNVGAHDEGNKPQAINNRNNYLSQLPEDSALKKASENTPIRSCYLFRDDKQAALVHLQSGCKSCHTTITPDLDLQLGLTFIFGDKLDAGGVGREDIRNAIRTMLPNEPDKLKWQELKYVLQLVHKLNAERKQQLEEERERKEEERKMELLTEGDRPF